jgi:pyruvate/2-oxoglutarate dehydrogenase complex dihydrolipoamide acyltransferase (E2) component
MAHQNATVSVDVAAALAYLESLNARGGPRVSLSHLAAAAIARALVEHPAANARVVGWRVFDPGHVGIAMPVSLEGHVGARLGELSLTVVPGVEGLTLRQIAARATRAVRAERDGDQQSGAVRFIFALAERLPMAALRRLFDGIEAGIAVPLLAAPFWGLAPATTALTNPGAVLRAQPGALARGLAIALPGRGLGLSTIWGLAGVQEEARVVGGQVIARPCLPLVLAFDHRTVDAILAGRLIARVAEVLADPGAVFGEDGERRPPTGVCGG